MQMSTNLIAGSLVAVAILAGQTTTTAAPIKIDRNVTYVERETGPMTADIYRPSANGPFPGVLVVHGGAWIVGNKSHMEYIGRRLAEEGFVAMSIDYRLAPRSLFPA